MHLTTPLQNLSVEGLGSPSAAAQLPSLPRRVVTKAAPLLFVVAVSVGLGLPMLLKGPLIDGHDTYEHLNYTKYFSEQFWHGDLYPRWLTDMNTGLGSPSYFVYPPLPAYICVLLQPLAKVLRFNAFNVAAWLPLVGSGIIALLWLETFVSRKVAIACAALYMLMPYHLAVDFYRRCAIPECWAFLWMPLILYFTLGAAAGKRRHSAGLAIAFGLMILSHLISVAMFFPIPIGLAMLLSPVGQRLRSGMRVVSAMALGTGMSAVYLLSALANAKYIPASRIVSFEVYKWSNNLVSFGPGLFTHYVRENFVQSVSWTAASMVVLVAVCAIAALRWGTHDSKTLVMFWVAVCGFAVFMMSQLSRPFWHHVHVLHQALQFPWRFSGILCVGALALIAVSLSSALSCMRPSGIIFLGLLILLLGTWVFSYANVWRRYKVDVWSGERDEDHLIDDDDGWLPAWIAPGTRQRSSLIASAGPKVRFKEGSGSAKAVSWRPRHIELETNSLTGGWVMINQFYYPTWKAELASQGKPAMLRTATPEGLLEVHVPPGTQRVRVDIPVSFMEYLGRSVSALCVFFCLTLSFRKKPHNTRGGIVDLDLHGK